MIAYLNATSVLFLAIFVGCNDAGKKESHATEEADTPKSRYALVTSISFSPDGRQIASANLDYVSASAFFGRLSRATVTIWDTRKEEPRLILDAQKHYIQRIAFSPDGEWIVAAFNQLSDVLSKDDRAEHAILRAWKIFGRRGEWTVKGYRPISDLAFNSDGTTIASADGAYGTVTINDLATGKELTKIDVTESGFVDCIAFSPNGKLIAAGVYSPASRGDTGNVTLRGWRPLYAAVSRGMLSVSS